MWSGQRRWSEAFFIFPRLNSGRLDLTFVWVASLDVSGDADNGQGVDACKAEEQGEETVYLEENGERVGESWRHIFIITLSGHLILGA